MNKKILVLMFLLLFLPLVGCFPPPTNQVPILTSDPITIATVGTKYVYDVNATDPDGDTLVYSLSAKPTNMTINSASGLINWTPVTTQVGDNSVTVKVSDGSLSITQSFTIKVSTFPVVNQAPVIYSTQITTATVGVIYVYDVNATDPNGDTLVYSLTTYPSNMAINSATGLIWWTPTSAQVGNNLVIVKAFDGALSDTQSFIIIVSTPLLVNQAPVITLIPDLIAIVGEPFTYNVEATDPNAGDVLTYSLTVVPETPSMVIDADSGVITWPITAEGSFDVTVKVEDEEGLFDTQDFTIEVTVPTPSVHNITTDEYYITIEGALDEAEDYNIIEVAAGTYKPDATLTIKDKDLTLKSINGPTTTIIDFIDVWEEDHKTCISIEAQYVTVEGFTVKHSSTTPIVGIWTDANNTTVTGNKLYNATIYLAGGSYSIISNNTFPDKGGINLEGKNINNVTITGNNISFANISLLPEDETDFLGSTYDNLQITENTITKNAYSNGAIRIAANTTNLTITHNNITENENGGITIGAFGGDSVAITWDDNNVIRYNNIEGNGGFGLKVYDTVGNGGIIVDVILNWWGAASGPSGGLADSVDSEKIAVGTGDAIVNDSAVGINFYPFSKVEN